MSYVFDVDGDTVWSPSLQVGDLYVRFLRQIGEMLEIPTGLTAVASDLYDIDINIFNNLTRKLFEIYLTNSHPVLRGMVEAVLAPSVVILERSGRPLSPSSAEGQELIDRAQKLSMTR